ncbi:MAG: hypothetical protein IPH75_04085 [bacterium]|nr:hypothetical protein [bacterium]
MKLSQRTISIVLPAIALFGLFAWQLNFTQDDAYISYRYVANFLNGHGLVFNIGEQVEGYTNFFWVILMSLAGWLGADYVFVSKLLGALCGAGTIIVSFLIAERLFHNRSIWYAVMAVALLATNGAFAYWSPAGLETAAFSLAVALAVYWYLVGNWMLIAALTWGVLLRPEGAVLAALLIAAEYVSERKVPRFSFLAGFIAFCLCLPFVGFKLSYYGSILPNPFYAKTGFNATQFSNGVEYTWLFLKHYGFLGIGVLVALAMYRSLSTEIRAVLVILVGYLAYILLVGGDVLKVHRFYLPLFGLNAIILAAALHSLLNKLALKTQQLLVIVAIVPLVFLTWWVPKQYVQDYNRHERAFVFRMGTLAKQLRESDPRTFSVATPTIGIFGYELLGHRVIDMLGLADSTIARYSDPPIEGMQTTWKESKHNSSYLLTCAPDYVVFSTGIKPSAPAERALVLYDEFQESYRALVWWFQDADYSPRGMLNIAYKKMRDVRAPGKPSLPVEFAEKLNQGLDAGGSDRPDDAVKYLNEAARIAGGLEKVRFTELHWTLGQAYLVKRESEQGIAVLETGLAIDSMTPGIHRDLYTVAALMEDQPKVALHREWLKQLIPWYLPRLDSITQQRLERARQGSQQP